MNYKKDSGAIGVIIAGIILLLPALTKLITALTLSNTYYEYDVLKEHYFKKGDYAILMEMMNEIEEASFAEQGIVVDCSDMYTEEFTKYIMEFTMCCYFKGEVPTVDREIIENFVDDSILPVMMQVPGNTASVMYTYKDEFVDYYVKLYEAEGQSVKSSGASSSYASAGKMQTVRTIICAVAAIIILFVVFKQSQNIFLALQVVGSALAISCIYSYVRFKDIYNVFSKKDLNTTEIISGTDAEFTSEMVTRVINNLEGMLQLANPYLFVGIVVGVILFCAPFIMKVIVGNSYEKSVVKPQIINNSYDDLDAFMAQDALAAPVAPTSTIAPVEPVAPTSTIDPVVPIDPIMGGGMNVNTDAFSEQASSEYTLEKEKYDEQSYEDFSSLFGNFSTAGSDDNKY